MPFELTSPTFVHGEPIPRKYTCDGEDISPPLRWSDPPQGTQSLALIADDPDAPVGTWVHWVLYNLPAETTQLAEGLPRDADLKELSALQGKNSLRSENLGYRGPMPPPGHGVHHYHFRLFALDAPLDLPPGATEDELFQAMAGHILAEGELIGTYERK